MNRRLFRYPLFLKILLSEALIRRCFVKKVFLKNFAKFTGKHLCQSLFFNKVAGLGPAALLKRRPWDRCFPVNFAKFLRMPFLTEHLRWLLLEKAAIMSVYKIKYYWK